MITLRPHTTIVAIVVCAMAAVDRLQADESASGQLQSYLPLLESHLGKLITDGLDVYGPKHTAMWMAVIDTRTGRHPDFEHTPKRVYRLIGAPRGSALYWDQPLTVAAIRLSEVTGKAEYARAVDRYVEDFLAACVASNGMFQWGNHCYYDAYTDKLVPFSGGYHELRPHAPDWDQFWRVAPERTERYLRTMAARHIHDPPTGGFNRHDDGKRGHAFLESGGVLIESLAWLYGKKQDPELLDTALRIARYSFGHRGESTGLVRNEPDMGRWDARVCTTEIAVWANSLLRAAEWTGNDEFRQMARDAVAAYLKYGYDEASQQYYGQLSVADGRPVELAKVGYWPRKYSNIWNADQWPTHDYPMAMAEACLTLYQQTGDPQFREGVHRWAEIVCRSPRANRPRAFADQYGQCIHFLVRAARQMEEPRWLSTARELADEAVERLYDNGWFQSYPDSHLHEAVGGVGYLFQALLLLETEK
ncbi:MAG: hypothetical protein ACODAD_12050 [Planctomycetota bacterium]